MYKHNTSERTSFDHLHNIQWRVPNATPYHAVFSTLLSRHSLQVEIFFSEHCLQKKPRSIFLRDTLSFTLDKEIGEIKMCTFYSFGFDSRWEDERVCRPGSKQPKIILHVNIFWVQFWSAAVMYNYQSYAIFSKNILPTFITRLYLAVLWRDVDVYLVFIMFTPRTISLLASNNDSWFSVVFLSSFRFFSCLDQSLMCPI